MEIQGQARPRRGESVDSEVGQPLQKCRLSSHQLGELVMSLSYSICKMGLVFVSCCCGNKSLQTQLLQQCKCII